MPTVPVVGTTAALMYATVVKRLVHMTPDVDPKTWSNSKGVFCMLAVMKLASYRFPPGLVSTPSYYCCSYRMALKPGLIRSDVPFRVAI